MLVVNILNSQNRKYVNTTSSVILAYAIAFAPHSRSFTRKRKNNPVVVGGRGGDYGTSVADFSCPSNRLRVFT